jgi:hypothetical protein
MQHVISNLIEQNTLSCYNYEHIMSRTFFRSALGIEGRYARLLVQF